MMSGGFGEPLAYSLRIEKILQRRRGDFDIIHDNQCMGPGILKLHREGWPLLETLHHPITVDRSIALDHAETAWKRYTTRRWFGFLRMQMRTLKQLPAVLTVSHNSKIDINAQMHVRSIGSPSCRSASTTRSFAPTTTSSRRRAA